MGVRVAWSDNTTDEDGFNIYRSTSPMDPGALPTAIATVGANVTHYDDGTVIAGTTYYYRVSAYKTGAEVISSELSIEVPLADPAAYRWLLNEPSGDWLDTGAAGAGVNGTSVGTVTRESPGLGGLDISAGIDVSVANGVINLGNTLNTIFSADNTYFRIKAKIKQTDLSAVGQFIMGNLDAPTNNRMFYFGAVSGKLRFIWYTFGNASAFRGMETTNVVLSLDTEHEVELRYDGAIDTNNGSDRVQIYVDGVLEPHILAFSQGSLGGIASNTIPTGIGGCLTNGGSYNSNGFQGLIGSVSLFTTPPPA